MKFQRAGIPDIVLVEPNRFGDERGFFFESWNRRVFAEAGIAAEFVQDNHSRSAHGVLRGLHYQLEKPQGKLVRVVKGAVFDVVVDVRRSSPTFGHWLGFELSETNQRMLWVPPGFAHGFVVSSASADFVYKCTEFYAPETERVLRWDDPAVGVRWPLPAGALPTLSARDQRGLMLTDAECFP
jgi:dTDP-4-dehydrorhamnose 3,5-epimerase